MAESASLAPLTCPICGAHLRLSPLVSEYECVQGHRYHGSELEQALRRQLQRTLLATARRIQEQEYLLGLLVQHGLMQPEKSPAVLPLVNRLLEQVTRPLSDTQ